MNSTRGTRTRLFPPTSSSTVLSPGQEFASGSPDIEAQTLIITVDGGKLKDSPVSSDGVILVQVDRVYEKARRPVRFALARFQTVALDLSQADSIEAWVLRSTLTGVGLAISWAPRPLPAALSWATWPEATASSGTWAVPPGATEVLAATADPGFAWRSSLLGSGAASVPTPLAVGDCIPVQGPLYTTSAAFTGLWRIQL